MVGIRESVDLDITRALAQVQRLEQAVAKISRVPVGGGPAAPVDTGGLERARRSTQGLVGEQDRLRRATDATTAATGKYGRTLQTVAQIRVVQGLVAFFGGRALVRQIADTVQAASDLTEEVSRTAPVFGDAAGRVQAFGESATTSVGLARREAIRAANDFGTMFRGAGLGAEGAARLSEQFVRLGADIASFSNLTIDDALTKLRAGLAGEIEPLRRIGFGFNDAEVQAKAFALGLADTNGELTEAAKLQARIAVIMEKTRLAQGDLARTSEGLANQQRFLRAEASQLREELGQQLEPVFLELVRAARENLPVLGELASSLIPLLIAALHALNPAGQAFLQLLVAFAPALEAVAVVLDAIPAPVLQIVGTMILLNKAVSLSARGLDMFRGHLSNIAEFRAQRGVGGLLPAFTALNVGVAAAAIGLTIFTGVLARNRQRQEENRRAVRELTDALLDQSKAVGEDVRAFTRAELEPFSAQLREAGITISDVAEAAARGSGEFGKFFRQLAAGAVAGGRQTLSTFEDLGDALERINERLQEGAKNAIDSSVTLERFTDAEARAAEKANTAADGTVNYLAALIQLDPALADAVVGTANFGGAAGETTTDLEKLDEKLGDLRDTLDSVFGRFLDSEEATARVSEAVRDMAEALGEGRREGETTLQFQERLASQARTVARAVEDQVEAWVRSGRLNAADAQGEIARQLGVVRDQFPELTGQLNYYIGLLGGIPSDATTRVTVDTSQAQAAIANYIALLNRTIGAANVDPVGVGLQIGSQMVGRIATGISTNLGPVVAEGRAAGRATAEAAKEEVATTLRRSAGAGLNLGGFLVEGISLGARQAEIDLTNLVNSLTIGMGGVVAEATRIDTAEAAEILQAVADMDRATRDLAEARRELGADSIEAALAEVELAAAQERVNTVVAEAIDSTEAYDEALKRVTDGVDAVTGSLRGLNALQDARSGLRTAREDAEKARDALRQFDAAIAGAQDRLLSAQAGGDPTDIRRAEATLADLRHRRRGAAEQAREAEQKLSDAQLDLLDAQQRLVDLGPAVADAQGVWEGYLRSLASQAGLTRAEVDALVASLNAASQFTLDARTSVLTGGAPTAVPNLSAGALAGATLQAGSSVRTFTNTFYITAPDPVAAATRVVQEMRVEELLAG